MRWLWRHNEYTVYILEKRVYVQHQNEMIGNFVCGYRLLNDGNKTNSSAISAKIIQVVTKSTERVAGGWFVNDEYDFGNNCTT